MANALVMSGHLRTFKDIAEEVKHFVSLNELDVYLYIWDENNQDDIDYVVKTLQPVKKSVTCNGKKALAPCPEGLFFF